MTATDHLENVVHHLLDNTMSNTNFLPLEYRSAHQRRAYMQMKDTVVSDHGPTGVLFGQRSGKTVLAIAAVRLVEDPVVCIEPSGSLAVANFADERRRQNPRAATIAKGPNSNFVREMLRNPASVLQPDTVVVFDEALWIPNFDELFEAVTSVTRRVIAVSSRGPQGHVPECFFVTGATWDANPTITYESLLPQFRLDWERAARDYGLADSHDRTAEPWLRENCA